MLSKVLNLSTLEAGLITNYKEFLGLVGRKVARGGWQGTDILEDFLLETIPLCDMGVCKSFVRVAWILVCRLYGELIKGTTKCGASLRDTARFWGVWNIVQYAKRCRERMQ